MSPESKDMPASSEEKEQLLRELKKRLQEIAELKRKLGLSDADIPGSHASMESSRAESPPPESLSRINSDAVRDALEELVVPPLELLDDKPQAPKKKKTDGLGQST